MVATIEMEFEIGKYSYSMSRSSNAYFYWSKSRNKANKGTASNKKVKGGTH